MKNISRLLTAVILCMAVSTTNAAIIGFEDFDGGAINLSGTTNVFDYGSGGGNLGDVFGRVDGQLGGTGMPFDVADDTVADVSGARTGSAFPTDTLGLAGQNTGGFFALNDMNGDIDGSGNSLNDAVWSFSGFGSAMIDDITIDLAALGDFEAGSTDGFRIEAQLDSGGFQEIFRGRTDEAAFKSYRALDNGFVFSDDDPLELFIDGVATGTYLDKSDPTTGDFDSFTSTLFAGQSASMVDIRVSWAGTPSGSEPMGIDNITINGTTAGSTAIPEPASTAFLLAGIGGFGAYRLRRRNRVNAK